MDINLLDLQEVFMISCPVIHDVKKDNLPNFMFQYLLFQWLTSNQ